MKESLPSSLSAIEKPKAPDLHFADAAPEVWAALAALPRTGWVRRGVLNPESVQDHIVALRELAASLTDLSGAEKDGLLDMLEVHDWPEAIHGDEVIVTFDEQEKKKLKEIKFENEKRALSRICSGLGETGERIMSLWLRFESSADDAAVFARQLDKYQAIEKALEYEKAQSIPMFEEFLTSYSSRSIIHPLLVERLDALKSEWESLKKA